jgi:heme A synthase
LAGLCTALFVHLRSVLHLPVPADAWPGCPLSFALFAGAALVCMSMIRDASDGRVGSVSNSRIVAGMSTWVRFAIGACAVYVALNFAWGLVGHGEKVYVTDGKAIAYASGVSHALSEGEYRDYLEWQVRIWSGHCLIFYLVPAFYFLLGPGAKRRVTLIAS